VHQGRVLEAAGRPAAAMTRVGSAGHGRSIRIPGSRQRYADGVDKVAALARAASSSLRHGARCVKPQLSNGLSASPAVTGSVGTTRPTSFHGYMMLSLAVRSGWHPTCGSISGRHRAAHRIVTFARTTGGHHDARTVGVSGISCMRSGPCPLGPARLCGRRRRRVRLLSRWGPEGAGVAAFSVGLGLSGGAPGSAGARSSAGAGAGTGCPCPYPLSPESSRPIQRSMRPSP
jgi:hypothetical protein